MRQLRKQSKRREKDKYAPLAEKGMSKKKVYTHCQVTKRTMRTEGGERKKRAQLRAKDILGEKARQL